MILFRSLNAAWLAAIAYIFKIINFFYYLVYASWKNDTLLVLRNLFIIFVCDSVIMDDEPLWEPLEWSMLQTWLLWIFVFSWVAEILIDARFGGYVGRDKRVWYAWYNSFFLIEIWYVISFGAAFLFISTPFYYEITYYLSSMVSWWNWVNRVYLCKVFFLYSTLSIWLYFLQLRVRFWNWKILFLHFLILELLFLIFFFWIFLWFSFAYSTDLNFSMKTRTIADISLSSEPLKWSWDVAPRDHFYPHRSTSSIWFKNDLPWASSMLLLNGFFLLSLFFINFFLIIFLRRVWALQEVPLTYLTYVISAIRHSFLTFMLVFSMLFLSWIGAYWRFPIEFLAFKNIKGFLYQFSTFILSFFLNVIY